MTQAVLAEIATCYLRARGEADARAASSPSCLTDFCRYCGKRWQHWAGSKLDGHAKCIVPQWFKETLRELFAQHPSLSYAMAAHAIGVSIATMRSWVSPIAPETASTREAP